MQNDQQLQNFLQDLGTRLPDWIASRTLDAPSLDKAIAEFKNEFMAGFPPDKAAVMLAATEQLRHELGRRRRLIAGDLAPLFDLPNQQGMQISLERRLRNGPVIIVFYRGAWCPYCNLTLRFYQRELHRITKIGGSLIAISPQLPDRSLQTAEENSLGFDVLSDVGSAVAATYHVAFRLPPALRDLYQEIGHPLPESNGGGQWTLPVPGTFVIGSDRRLLLTHIDPDYRNRLEPSLAIDALATLS